VGPGIVAVAGHAQGAVLQQLGGGGAGAAAGIQVVGAVAVLAVGVGYHVGAVLVELALIGVPIHVDGGGGAVLKDHVQADGLAVHGVGGEHQQPVLGVGGGLGLEQNHLSQAGEHVVIAALLADGVDLDRSARVHVAHVLP